MGGPRCRNCHRGSSGCGGCHNTSGGVNPSLALTKQEQEAEAADNTRTDITQFFMMAMGDPNHTQYKAYTMYNLTRNANGDPVNDISLAYSDTNLKTQIIKVSRKVNWGAPGSDWRTNPGVSSSTCSDDGLSWPHRTLGYMMLKDDLFGIDVVGNTDGTSQAIGPNQIRQFGGLNAKTHDIDSVCLDCHNPTTWAGGGAGVEGHTDTPGTTADDKYDDVILRGLP
ncbi:MAG: hypothetical protein K6T91_06365 [Firmicutes bacterium]|nr:hypothetical protein [Bacillota bacterium]